MMVYFLKTITGLSAIRGLQIQNIESLLRCQALSDVKFVLITDNHRLQPNTLGHY